ncbi:TRAP transporter small permease [Sporomusa sp.]|uniref:TRAP transporter small permease n=1 Tax=Sporomusa sp. TaxID=2078658 RepID=UPI002B5EFD73|nr:TRAP transporter small permease [Sporomusa sp.]HWR44479.1 TRAP transporter small permease [Sporomusa sp.]
MGKFMEMTTRLMNYLIAAALSLMAVFVFGNVILRYFFNSGLTWAEEVSRFLFIWLIFLGAILALRDNEHLGVDTLVRKLSLKGKKILFVINNVIILITLLLVLDGSWKLTILNIDQSSPAIGLPYAYVYVSGVVMSIGMAVIVIRNLYRLLSNKIDENDLVMTTDSEEKTDFDQEIKSIQGGTKS